jgi:hypothetical protein
MLEYLDGTLGTKVRYLRALGVYQDWRIKDASVLLGQKCIYQHPAGQLRALNYDPSGEYIWLLGDDGDVTEFYLDCNQTAISRVFRVVGQSLARWHAAADT